MNPGVHPGSYFQLHQGVILNVWCGLSFVAGFGVNGTQAGIVQRPKVHRQPAVITDLQSDALHADPLTALAL